MSAIIGGALQACTMLINIEIKPWGDKTGTTCDTTERERLKHSYVYIESILKRLVNLTILLIHTHNSYKERKRERKRTSFHLSQFLHITLHEEKHNIDPVNHTEGTRGKSSEESNN